MSESTRALVIWLPAGTLLPYIISRLTGADRHGAIIEAAIFATFGLLIYPTLFALLTVRFIAHEYVDALFAAGYLLAALTVVGYRRGIAPVRRR